MKRDLLAYQESLNLELRAAMNRVRHLIGDAHWLTDGEHKESVLRQVLKNRLPTSATVGTGFVCFPSDDLCIAGDSSFDLPHSSGPVTSRQIDILISATSEPSLYRDGDLTFVTPEAVLTLIEVKTKLNKTTLEKALSKLARDIAAVRQQGRRGACEPPPV